MAPYVGKSLVYKIVDSMTVSIDNILEYAWKKNERYSCQLCIKNTRIKHKMFNNIMEELFTKTTPKINFIREDFNIDLFNPNIK